jgi:hypothetical protein
MATIEQSVPIRTSSRGGVSRFAGIGFVVFYLAASVLLLTGPSVYEDGSLSAYEAGFADGARELPVSLSAFILMPIAGAFLVWAVSHISTTLTAGAAGSAAGRVARLGAVAMAALLTVAGAASSAAEHLASGTGDGFPADVGAGYAIDLLGGQVGGVAPWGGAVALVALGIIARRTGGLPGWLVWVGFVSAPLLVVSWVFFSLPTTVFLVWVAVAGVVAKPPATATEGSAG